MYNKIFTKILDSSIWLEDTSTRIVWITLLAAMDQDGYAHFSAVENLAIRAHVSLEETEKAVALLTSPDSNSADSDHEGRRIERVPGGFIVLNAMKHRELVTKAVQREQTRKRSAKYRDKKKCNASVTHRHDSVTQSYAEAVSVSDTKDKTLMSGKPDPVKLIRKTAKTIIVFLNEKTGKNFQPVDANISIIVARIKEGYTEEDFRKVIAKKTREWSADEKMAEFLRPKTLFNKTNFANYVGELVIQETQDA